MENRIIDIETRLAFQDDTINQLSDVIYRQQQQIDQVKRQSLRKLPANLDYASIGTLSREAREKLAAIQPTTLGQATHIPGVSQADLTALLLWLELQQRKAKANAGLASSANSR